MNAALKLYQQDAISSLFVVVSEFSKRHFDGAADCEAGKPASSDDEHYLKGYALQYERGERETANQRPF